MTFPTTGRRRRIVIVNDRMQRGYQYERIAPTTDPASAERAERYRDIHMLKRHKQPPRARGSL